MTDDKKNTRSTTAANAKKAASSRTATARSTAGNAKEQAQEAKKSTVSTAQSVGDTTQRVSRAAVAGLQTGQQVVAANTAKAVEVAGTAWTVIKHRKAVAAAAAAGVAGVAGAAFAIGRSTAKPQMGPLTRLARGRI
ncbi:hypothetical protein AB0P02_26415 [Streptomyces griseoluteus]|uniref:hypothetical protein n=1 Tax=Streptomyces griseoluteus TaxID=29306 RepID=UPI00343FEFDE